MNKNLTDYKLLAGLKDNCHDSFKSLFNLYYSKLCSFALTLVKSKDLAEEIVQETFIKFWETRDAININVSFKAYIYKSVYNHCLIFIKKRETLRFKYNNMAREIIYHYDLANLNLDSNMQELMQEIGQENRLDKIMETLPGQCKLIFNKSRFERQTYQEIADEMGLSVNTIKTQMKRALNKLREGYKKVYANAIL